MSFDPSADFLLFDGLANVSFYSRAAGDRYDAAVTVSALRRAVDSTEIPTGPAYVNRRVVAFHMLVSSIPSPKRGDKIVDDATWAVDTVSKQTLNTRYKLVCVEIP